MYPGVTLSNIDVGSSNATWSCISAKCKAIAACEADCKCSDLFVQALMTTKADPTQAKTAFTAAAKNGQLMTGESGVVIPVAICLQSYASMCPAWGSGGADATTD